MKLRGTLVWLGGALGIGYWFLEALLHTFLFRSGPFADTLVCRHDPNELWMRIVIVVLFVVFGVVAQRAVDSERRMREDARRIGDLRQLVDDVRDSVHASDAATAEEPAPSAVETIDEIAALSRTLRELPPLLTSQFRDLHALLQLTREINQAVVLENVLDKAWEVLRSVIPYNRLGVALLDEDGETVRARWARSDYPRILLGRNYSAQLRGSSLQSILESREPRIINDLEGYLVEHPASVSTRMMVMEGIRSSLTCPLISMGRPVGFLFFSSRNTDVYRNVHVDVFRLIAGHLSVMVEKGLLVQQILREKERSEALLLNVMPTRVAERLSAGEETIAEALPMVTILFADIVAFTNFASGYPPERVVSVLRDVFVAFDGLCDQYGVEKIKTIGDEYMAITVSSGGASQIAVRDMADFALHMLRTMRNVAYPGGKPIELRIGFHTGPAVAGVIGQKKFGYDIWGDAVNVASRMQTTGRAGRIHVTDAVYEALKDDYAFELRGDIDVKGKGLMRTWFLVGRKDAIASRAILLPERERAMTH